VLDGYDIHHIFSEEFGDSIQRVCLADGEITVLPHRDKLLALVKEKRWHAEIYTNAIVFNKDIADLMKDNLAHINVSLDCGTPSTYRKMKCVNAFAKVIANLEKYAETGGHIILKYIMFPGFNDSFEDINGFLDIAKKLKVDCIVLSNEMRGGKKSKPISEPQFAMYAYFAARCKELKIPVNYVAECFLNQDSLRMDLIT
jgi:pyruvate-formate lyase-activating enzyme